MQIIPAIDVIDGKAVRLTRGDFLQKKIYADDPVQLAKYFFDNGFERLHLVDLDGAKKGSIQNLDILINISRETDLKIDFGGGVRSLHDVKRVLEAGAAFCTVGSIAALQPLLFQSWIDAFSPEKFLVGADVLNGTIRVSGWVEDSALDLFAFLDRLNNLEIVNFFCTDISKDGAMQGPATQLYSAILEKFPSLELTASGGVTSLEDLHELKAIGCKGAIIGKAIYEETITIDELLKWNKAC